MDVGLTFNFNRIPRDTNHSTSSIINKNQNRQSSIEETFTQAQHGNQQVKSFAFILWLRNPTSPDSDSDWEIQRSSQSI